MSTFMFMETKEDASRSIDRVVESIKLVERLLEHLKIARESLANDMAAMNLTLDRLAGEMNEVLEADLK